MATDIFNIWIHLFSSFFFNAHSCSTLWDPVDCSPSGSSVHGILQARILEWAALPSSRGSCRPRDQTHVSYVSCIGRQVFLPPHYLGSLDISANMRKRRVPMHTLRTNEDPCLMSSLELLLNMNLTAIKMIKRKCWSLSRV